MRQYWEIEYTWWSAGPYGTDYIDRVLFWGTWYEAARYCIKQCESVGRPKGRSVKPFTFPDVSKKRKGFVIF